MTTQQQYLAQLAQNPEIAPQIQGLERQRKMAEMLMQQGAQAPQGQMVSGHYVAPSPMQYLGNLAQIWAGKSMGEESEKKAIDLATELRKQQAKQVQDYFNLESGRPGQVMPVAATSTDADAQPSGFYGEKPATVNVGGVSANPQAAMAMALSSGNPLLQQLAVEKLKGYKLGEGEVQYRWNPASGKMESVAEGGEKKSNEMRNYEAAVKQGFKGTFMDYELGLKRAGASISNTVVNTGQRGFQNYKEMKDSFKSEPVYKAFQEIQSAHSQIKEGLKQKSPAGDLAASTKFMKLLDPGSVVRESELGMAMSAAGLTDRLRNYGQMLASGQKLTPTQRKDFNDLADKFFNSAVNQYNSKRKEYVDVANQFQLNPNLAVGGEAKSIESKSNW